MTIDDLMPTAITDIRLGQTRNALAMLTAVAAAEVALAMPMYSDTLRLSMPARWHQVEKALLDVAARLSSVAATLHGQRDAG